MIYREKHGGFKRGQRKRLDALVANKLRRQQLLVAQQPEQPQAASVIRRAAKPAPKYFEPAVIKQPAAPEPEPKIFNQDAHRYPLHDRQFFDDGTAWRPTELTDEYLLDAISIYEDRVKSSRIPSEKDKERLRAMEQELQRRRGEQNQVFHSYGSVHSKWKTAGILAERARPQNKNSPPWDSARNVLLFLEKFDFSRILFLTNNESVTAS